MARACDQIGVRAETVGVVVPVFERPTAVVEALDSVLAQERRPEALVVVDDGSEDSTPARVDRWVEDNRSAFAALEFVRQANCGVSAARNRALEALPGIDLVAFLDSDDLWPPHYLKEQVWSLSTDGRAVASTADKMSLDVPSGRERRAGRAWVARDTTREIVLRGPPGVSNTVFRRRALEAAGRFDEQLRTAEDFDLMLRLSRFGPWLHASSTFAHYRHRLGESRGEAPSLGHAHADRRRTRAEVLDGFLASLGPADGPLFRLVRRVAGRQWARAGRQLARAGRADEAVSAFGRAIERRPLDVRSRWERFRTR